MGVFLVQFPLREPLYSIESDLLANVVDGQKTVTLWDCFSLMHAAWRAIVVVCSNTCQEYWL